MYILSLNTSNWICDIYICILILVDTNLNSVTVMIMTTSVPEFIFIYLDNSVLKFNSIAVIFSFHCSKFFFQILFFRPIRITMFYILHAVITVKRLCFRWFKTEIILTAQEKEKKRISSFLCCTGNLYSKIIDRFCSSEYLSLF